MGVDLELVDDIGWEVVPGDGHHVVDLVVARDGPGQDNAGLQRMDLDVAVREVFVEGSFQATHVGRHVDRDGL